LIHLNRNHAAIGPGGPWHRLMHLKPGGSARPRIDGSCRRRRAACIAGKKAMTTNSRNGVPAAIAVLLLGLAGCVSRPTWRGDEGTAYDILNRSTIALLEIDREALAGPLGSSMRQACAVFIFPGKVVGIPASAAARGDGVLLVRDRATGHWSGPAFYALRGRDRDIAAGEHAEGRRWMIAVGCDALQRIYTDAMAAPASAFPAATELDDAALADMTGWSLSSRRASPQPLVAMALRPLPVITFAYYQAPASLAAITRDRSVSNDASAEIQAAIEGVAN
jgi:hypothetical protein